MLRKRGNERLAFGEFEVGKLEPRRDIATHERVEARAVDVCRKPRTGHDRVLPAVLAAQHDLAINSVRADDFDDDRRTTIVMPDFVRSHAVESRELGG